MLTGVTSPLVFKPSCLPCSSIVCVTTVWRVFC